MKTMMIFLLTVFTFSSLQAQEEPQEEQQLGEAKVFHRHKIKVTVNKKAAAFDVKEDYKGQFRENPVKFCDETFDIEGLIESMDSDEYTQYEITFTTNKGYINALYDEEGELLKTSQKFKDILLPPDVRQKLFHDYNGWTMTKNKYIASGQGNRVDREKWRIGMRKGNISKNVKIDPAEIPGERIAGN